MTHSTEFVPDSKLLLDLQARAEAEGRECVVGGLIVDRLGRVLVQKRAMSRRLFPACWDIPGGHVESGETLYQGLAREIREETGWELARIVDLVSAFDWKIVQDGRAVWKREFDFLVEVVGDLDHPRLEREKFTEFRWIGIEDVEMLRQSRTEGDVTIYESVRLVLSRRRDTER